MRLNLSDIADILGLRGGLSTDPMITGISIDSRTVHHGDLFFALPGDHADGHTFVTAALDAGAAAAVISEDVASLPAAALVLKTANVSAALVQLASAYRSRFSVPVIAITGSNGKTTTKNMIAEVLAGRYRVGSTPGNLNNGIGLPLSICGWNADIEIAVLEMGTNHFGEIADLCRIARPTHGLITNIGKGHLEYFQNLEGVAKAKRELLTWLAADGTAFLNGDDAMLTGMQTVAAKTITYGSAGGCDLHISDISMENGFPLMQIAGHTLRVPLPGGFSVMNAAAAVAVARHFDVPWNDIIERIEAFTPAARRMELLRAGEIVIINDCYNANPTSMRHALSALKEMTGYKRRIAVLGDMAEVGAGSSAEHEIVGNTVLSQGYDAFFATGPHMCRAADAAAAGGMKRVYWFKNRARLLDALIDFCEAGDILLVKGSRNMIMEEISEGLISHMQNQPGSH